jgi:hypothetical protein
VRGESREGEREREGEGRRITSLTEILQQLAPLALRHSMRVRGLLIETPNPGLIKEWIQVSLMSISLRHDVQARIQRAEMHRSPAWWRQVSSFAPPLHVDVFVSWLFMEMNGRGGKILIMHSFPLSGRMVQARCVEYSIPSHGFHIKCHPRYSTYIGILLVLRTPKSHRA